MNLEILDKQFIHAVKNSNLKLIKKYLKKGANIHAREDYALRWSAINGHIEVVKYLVENGANIHAEEDYALRSSAENGHIEVVKYLVEKGANIFYNKPYNFNKEINEYLSDYFNEKARIIQRRYLNWLWNP